MTATFCLPFVSYHATKHSEKTIRVDHNTEGCKNLGKFGSKLLKKGIVLEKLTAITYTYIVGPIILQPFKQIKVA